MYFVQNVSTLGTGTNDPGSRSLFQWYKGTHRCIFERAFPGCGAKPSHHSIQNSLEDALLCALPHHHRKRDRDPGSFVPVPWVHAMLWSVSPNLAHFDQIPIEKSWNFMSSGQKNRQQVFCLKGRLSEASFFCTFRTLRPPLKWAKWGLLYRFRSGVLKPGKPRFHDVCVYIT